MTKEIAVGSIRKIKQRSNGNNKTKISGCIQGSNTKRGNALQSQPEHFFKSVFGFTGKSYIFFVFNCNLFEADPLY